MSKLITKAKAKEFDRFYNGLSASPPILVFEMKVKEHGSAVQNLSIFRLNGVDTVARLQYFDPGFRPSYQPPNVAWGEDIEDSLEAVRHQEMCDECRVIEVIDELLEICRVRKLKNVGMWKN